MNGTDELPPGHFWDPEAAKREYYRIAAGLDEAKEKLLQAQARLQTVRVVYDCFRATPGIAVFEPRTDIDLDHLNKVLNPHWLHSLPKGGQFEANSMNDYRITHAPWHGCLVTVRVESEPVKAAVWFTRHKKRTGNTVGLRIPYSYTQWVSWYTPTGDVGMSAMERSLRDKASPFASPNHLYDKLMGEAKQEVYALLAPLARDVVLKFTPDLGPSNIEEIHLSSGEYKKDVPELSWHTLTRHAAPQTGTGYHLTSYADICWINYGRWESHRFPQETLQYVKARIVRIFDRLREHIYDTAWQVIAVEEEIAALRRRKEKLRILHYKPPVYREFWSAMQTTER